MQTFKTHLLLKIWKRSFADWTQTDISCTDMCVQGYVWGTAQLPRKAICITKAGWSAGGLQSLLASPPGSPGSSEELWDSVEWFLSPTPQRGSIRLSGTAWSKLCSWDSITAHCPYLGWIAGLRASPCIFFPFNKSILVRHFFPL